MHSIHHCHETEGAKWNLAIIHSIIYASAFPAVASQNVSHEKACWIKQTDYSSESRVLFEGCAFSISIAALGTR